MSKEITLIKNNAKRDWSDEEWIAEFMAFLQGNLPEGMQLRRGHEPNLTEKKAWAVVWYLQEHFSVLPDHIEKCHGCGYVFDSYREGLYWESKGRFYCGTCSDLVPENYDKGKR